MTLDLRLDGKVAVVTGASTGLGRGIAALFAAHGAKLVLGDTVTHPPAGGFDADSELTTVELIAAGGGEALFRLCDVTRSANVVGLIAAAVQRFGRLDVLVNNAGVYRGGGRIHELTEADLEACWAVQVKGSWFAAQQAVRTFLAQGGGGSIINIVSTAGLRAHAFQSAYNIAKAGQASLTRCLALEYGRDGIRTNGICPTYAKTAMSRSGFDSADFDAYVQSVIPLGRWGEISDVANLALYLASDAASFINGALIPVDGGEVLGAPV